MTATQLNVALHREIATDFESGDTSEQIKESITEGFKGLKLLKEGKLQAKPIKVLLEEQKLCTQ